MSRPIAPTATAHPATLQRSASEAVHGAVTQIERRKRTRHLIELGGLVVKAGVVDLTGDDRATIYGAMIWMADKLKSEDGEQTRELWAGKGKEAFAAEQETTTPTTSHPQKDRA